MAAVSIHDLYPRSARRAACRTAWHAGRMYGDPTEEGIVAFVLTGIAGAAA
jgi:hypothetical protein